MAATDLSAIQRLQPHVPTALFFLALLIMSFSFAWQTAQGIALMSRPLAVSAAPSPPLKRVVSSAALTELFGQASIASQSAQPTDLQLILRACFVDQLAEHSTALIATPGGAARRVRVGGEISPGVRLHAVRQNHVLLLRNGRQESLHFPQAQRPASLIATPLQAARNAQPSSFALTQTTLPERSAADTPRKP